MAGQKLYVILNKIIRKYTKKFCSDYLTMEKVISSKIFANQSNLKKISTTKYLLYHYELHHIEDLIIY